MDDSSVGRAVLFIIILSTIILIIKSSLFEQTEGTKANNINEENIGTFKPPILCVGGVQYYRLPTQHNIKGMAPVIDKETLSFVRC